MRISPPTRNPRAASRLRSPRIARRAGYGSISGLGGDGGRLEHRRGVHPRRARGELRPPRPPSPPVRRPRRGRRPSRAPVRRERHPPRPSVARADARRASARPRRPPRVAHRDVRERVRRRDRLVRLQTPPELRARIARRLRVRRQSGHVRVPVRGGGVGPYGLRLAALYDIPNAIVVFAVSGAVFAIEQRNTQREARAKTGKHDDGGVYAGEWSAAARASRASACTITRAARRTRGVEQQRQGRLRGVPLREGRVVRGRVPAREFPRHGPEVHALGRG